MPLNCPAHRSSLEGVQAMKKGSMGLLVLAHAAADINQGSIPAMLPFFIAEHHMSYAAAASFVFAVNIVSTLAQPLCGHITDRHSRPWLIPVSMLIIGFGVSFMGIAPSYRMGLAALMFAGLGVAIFHPEGARLMNHLAGAKKATAMSLFGIGGQLGFAIGPLLSTALLLWWGLKATTCLVLFPLMVAVPLMISLPRLSAGYERKSVSRSPQVKSEGEDQWAGFTCLSLALLVRSVIFYGLHTFLPLFWINVLHQSKATGGWVLAVLVGSNIMGNFIGGPAAERTGYRAVTVAAFALLCAMLPLLLLTRSAVWAMLLLIPIGLALSAPFGPMVALGQSYLPNRVGLASGITLGLAFSFGGLTTPLLGWIADHHGLRTTILVVALLPIISTVLAATLPAVGAGEKTDQAAIQPTGR
jgi:MFS transporter, FSR family, fosmidomycin resistance protein